MRCGVYESALMLSRALSASALREAPVSLTRAHAHAGWAAEAQLRLQAVHRISSYYRKSKQSDLALSLDFSGLTFCSWSSSRLDPCSWLWFRVNPPVRWGEIPAFAHNSDSPFQAHSPLWDPSSWRKAESPTEHSKEEAFRNKAWSSARLQGNPSVR